jgi:signal transduction histidine kinase
LIAETQKLSSIVTMLLQLARIAAEPAEFTRVDLVAVARRIAAEQVPTALEHGCDVAFEEPGWPLWVQGSETAIGVALSNLIRNAVYHAESGQPVLVEVAAPARLSVIDAGRGLQVGEPECLFDAFRRGNTRAEGVGLGLSIVFQVMTMHQGSVAIRETPGGGTTVELTFPLEQGHAKSTAPEQDEFHWTMPMSETLSVK